MADLISKLNKQQRKETLACCCGHEKYEKTVVCKVKGKNIELFSGKEIPREKRFYLKDRQGMYYIPEISG